MLVIDEDKRDLVGLGVAEHASLDVLAKVLHGFLHCANHDLVIGLGKPLGEGVERLAVDADRNRSATQKPALPDLLVILFHAAAQIVFHLAHVTPFFHIELTALSYHF